jgi:cytochrome c
MRSMPSILPLAIILGSMNATPVAQAAQSGEVAFNNRCRTCHSVREGDHRLGPSLSNIIGKKAGSSEYANYSQALGNSGVVWNEETLDKFIANPDAVISGNNMKPYAGLPDAAERKQIVDYLKSKASQQKK